MGPHRVDGLREGLLQGAARELQGLPAATPPTAHPDRWDWWLHAVANQLRREPRQGGSMAFADRHAVLDNAGENLQQRTPLVAARLLREKAETDCVTKPDCSENLLPRYFAHFSPMCGR